MSRRPVRLTAWIAVAALALAAAGCGGGGDDDGGEASSEPIKLFAIAPVETPIQNYPDVWAGAQAAAQALNEEGGIDGRQVEIVTCNTKSESNTATACARQAVDEGAIAVVGHVSTLTDLELPILEAGGVPNVGLRTSGVTVDWTSEYVFPIVGGSTSDYLAMPFAFKELGKQRLAIVYQDVPSALANSNLVADAAETAGMPVAGKLLLPGATTDFAPLAQKLRQLNPDAALFINSPGVSGGLIRAATGLGMDTLWAHNSGSISEVEAEQIGDAAKGMMIVGNLPSHTDTSYEGIQVFNEQMDAAGKTDPALKKVSGVNAWLAVHAVARVAESIDGEVTRESLLEALRAQEEPLELWDLASFAPGAEGPLEDFPRWTSLTEFFSRVGDDYSISKWGDELEPLPLVERLAEGS